MGAPALSAAAARRLAAHARPRAPEATSGATSAYDRAATLETYLRDNFTYSTHVANVPPEQDWVDYFLFDSKQGYCDYFATTMVVLLRAEGVPARVASGFAPGDFDPTTGISIVRENHAHTWVEAYFPGFRLDYVRAVGDSANSDAPRRGADRPASGGRDGAPVAGCQRVDVRGAG